MSELVSDLCEAQSKWKLFALPGSHYHSYHILLSYHSRLLHKPKPCHPCPGPAAGLLASWWRSRAPRAPSRDTSTGVPTSPCHGVWGAGCGVCTNQGPWDPTAAHAGTSLPHLDEGVLRTQQARASKNPTPEKAKQHCIYQPSQEELGET